MTTPADLTQRAREWLDLKRFSFGRTLIHVGINVMPDGRARRELLGMLTQWSASVRAALRSKAKEGG